MYTQWCFHFTCPPSTSSLTGCCQNMVGPGIEKVGNKFLFSSFDHLYICIIRLYHICTTLYHICILRLHDICTLWSSENRSFSTVDTRLGLWYRFSALLREKLLFNSIVPKEKLPWAWGGQSTNNAFYCFFCY